MLENAGLVDVDMSVCGPMDDEDQEEEVPQMDDEYSDDF